MSDSLSLGPDIQTITFNEIAASRRDPGMVVEIRPDYGNIGLLRLPSMMLVVSQMLAPAAGVAAANPGQLYPITADGQGEYLFGAGSVAALQIALIRANNTTTPLFAVGLVDAVGAVKATAQIDTAGTTLTNGFSCTVRIAGLRTPVVVPPGTTNQGLVTAIVAAINANANLPVTAAVATNPANLILTAKNAGLCGNDINVRITERSDASTPLIQIGLYAPTDVSPQAGGSSITLLGGLGNPVVAPVLLAAGGTWFTDIVCPWTDATNRAAIAAEGIRRYGANVNLDARFYAGICGTYANVVSYGDAGNSIQMITWPVRGQYEPGWMWGAALGAVHAFRLANDPSRQSKGIAVVGLTAPDPNDQWSPQERDLLLHNGLSTFTCLNDGTVVVGRTITGYLESNAGQADAAWLDVMTPATMTAIRYDFIAYSKLVYPQSKLFDDNSVGAEYDDTAVTPRRMRGTWAKRCLDYEIAGWIENVSETAPNSYFVRNASDKNRLDMQVTVRTAGNYMIGAMALEFAA